MSVCRGGISQLSVNWDEKLRWLGAALFGHIMRWAKLTSSSDPLKLHPPSENVILY